MEEMTLVTAAFLFAAASTPRLVPPAPVARVQRVSACTAATRVDVQQAPGTFINTDVDIGKLRQDASGSTCDYTGETGQVTIALHHSVAALDFNAEIANLKAALPEARLVEVTMPGVRALLVDVGGSGAQLHILRNGRDYLLVSVLGFGGSAQARTIAESIVHCALMRF
jgi:hypothetical protein